MSTTTDEDDMSESDTIIVLFQHSQMRVANDVLTVGRNISCLVDTLDKWKCLSTVNPVARTTLKLLIGTLARSSF